MRRPTGHAPGGRPVSPPAVLQTTTDDRRLRAKQYWPIRRASNELTLRWLCPWLYLQNSSSKPINSGTRVCHLASTGRKPAFIVFALYALYFAKTKVLDQVSDRTSYLTDKHADLYFTFSANWHAVIWFNTKVLTVNCKCLVITAYLNAL